ncbi:uncharacterized protein LOC119104634 isoform X2 [Pollicipes pollicipes]|uniref:uncharacterized protein LOC119104634 isoform X2 n=1 Tax=Pollicipes pollicipes TaxID=41117 RepID=UPI0018854A1C|nr:uncharacterized protein LOC119104634 isoform X2 [Pollicipes pollicipes]
MAPISLITFFGLFLTVTSEGVYSRGHGYAIGVTPRKRFVVKTVPVKRVSHGRKSTAVFRSPYDSYDEADAIRTADRDVPHKVSSYLPPYKPAVVAKKAVHVPIHTSHDVHVPVHAPHDTHIPVHTPHDTHVPVHTSHDSHVPVHASHDAHVPVHASHDAHVPVHASHDAHVPVHASHDAHVPVHASHDAHVPVHASHDAHVPVHASHDAHAPAVVLSHPAPKAHVPVPVPVSHDVAHVAHEPVAYHYDYHVVPPCALANQQVYNITVCLDDAEYPTETILHELKRDPLLTARLMSDVTYQSADNLVDGLTKAEEEQYSRQHYYGEAGHDAHLPTTSGYAYSDSYQRDGGYICPSDVFYARVKRAVNTYNEWKVIVNMPDAFVHDPAYKQYVQTSRLESCVHPGGACSFVDHLFPSSCLQKHAFVRLVAYDPKRGLHVDSFKLPSACSCHLAPKGGVYRA